jgi:hypothetical protein
MIGETGESNDPWNESFRRLHEAYGIGWCFWPYKNLDSDSAVVSILKPEGWDVIARAGSGSLAAIGADAPSLRERAQAILDAYLQAATFGNGRVNAGYLRSLGLSPP